MKKNILTMVMAAIASLFALTSCEKAPEDLIVGTWDLTAITMNVGGVSMDIDPSEMGVSAMQYTFKADGTFTASAEGESISGSYSVSAGEPSTLYMTIEGETQSFLIKQLDKETLLLEISESDGEETVKITITFKRK